MTQKPILAIIYDFDKTLCSDDMQNFSFIPALNMTPKEFWGRTGEFSKKTNMERILSYMYMMIECAKEKNIKLTREYLESLAKDIRFYEGVTTWFKRINEYAEEAGVIVEHYVVSSGTKEIIDGSIIANQFTKIYGCEFLYDENGEACWPRIAINYTAKTQYLFRISKGVLDETEDTKVNQRVEKRIPISNIVYIGDGITDVPCMTLVKEKGGRSIAIYPKGKKNLVLPLLQEERVNYICKADYRKDSRIEQIMKLIVDSIAITSKLLAEEDSI